MVSNKRNRPSGRAPWIFAAAGLIALGLLIAAIFIDRQNEAVERSRQQARVLEQLALLQSRLEGNLRSNVLLVRGLVSVIATQPTMTQAQFERAAKPLFSGRSQLRNIGAAPDMVIRYMYPLVGNEQAIGLDYRKTPAQFAAAERARAAGEIVLAGPLNLTQGGVGLIARLPVFLDDQAVEPGKPVKFWGLISAVIDVEALYRDSGLHDETLTIDVALRGRDALGAAGEVFFGDAALFEQESLQRVVNLPVGQWVIAARPKSGWALPHPWQLHLVFLVAGILIVGPLLLLGLNERRRHQAEVRLSRSEDWLSLAIVASNLVVWDWDINSGRLTGNPPLSTQLGLPDKSIEPGIDAVKARMHPEDIAQVEAAIEALLHDVSPKLETDFRLRDAGNAWRWFRVHGKVVARDVTDQPVRMAGVLQDVTSLKEVVRQLEIARASAEAASHAKSEFLATMSHEIRTPMNGVLGMAELLMTTPLDDEQREFVHTLQNSGRSLLNIINDILDFSKIEAGRLTIETINFDLGGLLSEVCALMRPRATEKGLLLELDCPADLPAGLVGDAHRIRQVLVNLIGNAIKFTQVGRVDVEVGWRPQDEGRLALVRISVRDTGIGIARDAQDRLFTHFTQVDASTTRRFGGTGLGLAICKRLIEAMGGRIACSSAPNEGACFWFELPLPRGAVATSLPVASAEGHSPDAASRFQGRVLVVEDNPVNLQVAQQMLERLGISVVGASNGRLGVEQFAAQHVDMVLMDMQMPEMDGLEATRTLRALQAGTGGPGIPIIALTANVQPEDRERCYAAGMNDFIAKPFRQHDLIRVLDRWLGNKVGAGETAFSVAAAHPQPASVEAPSFLPILEPGVLDDMARATGLSVAEITAMLFGDIERMTGELSGALPGMPLEDLRRLAHTIKSSAAQLGGHELSAIARDVEFAVRDGKIDALPVLLVHLGESFKRLKAAL
ncbi:MAG: ATP-binding protein [Rhodocyclaceae bacterium]|nr:ATP-binding protein [Rhodocyclaceae bacterium]MDZ4214190.1 ATP-binding protein [Rhodocyclaceae bacterium]